MRHEDDDFDEEEWQDDDEDDDGYVPCPHCGETMLEAADHCPSCDRWISQEDLPRKQHSWWVVAVIVVLLTAMIFTLF